MHLHVEIFSMHQVYHPWCQMYGSMAGTFQTFIFTKTVNRLFGVLLLYVFCASWFRQSSRGTRASRGGSYSSDWAPRRPSAQFYTVLAASTVHTGVQYSTYTVLQRVALFQCATGLQEVCIRSLYSLKLQLAVWLFRATYFIIKRVHYFCKRTQQERSDPASYSACFPCVMIIIFFHLLL